MGSLEIWYRLKNFCVKGSKKLYLAQKMEDLVLSCLESRVESNRNLYARFLVGPFLKGDALTVATALRRVLLSSRELIGITALYIQGITHEFSVIAGVRESVLELSLNFQAIVLCYDNPFYQKKNFFDETQIGYLQVQGPRVVYANDLKLPLGVKLVDPTQYIATVAKEGSIVLKFVIGKKNDLLRPCLSSGLAKASASPCFARSEHLSHPFALLHASSVRVCKGTSRDNCTAKVLVKSKDNCLAFRSVTCSRGAKRGKEGQEKESQVKASAPTEQRHDKAKRVFSKRGLVFPSSPSVSVRVRAMKFAPWIGKEGRHVQCSYGAKAPSTKQRHTHFLPLVRQARKKWEKNTSFTFLQSFSLPFSPKKLVRQSLDLSSSKKSIYFPILGELVKKNIIRAKKGSCYKNCFTKKNFRTKTWLAHCGACERACPYRACPLLTPVRPSLALQSRASAGQVAQTLRSKVTPKVSAGQVILPSRIRATTGQQRGNPYVRLCVPLRGEYGYFARKESKVTVGHVRARKAITTAPVRLLYLTEPLLCLLCKQSNCGVLTGTKSNNYGVTTCGTSICGAVRKAFTRASQLQLLSDPLRGKQRAPRGTRREEQSKGMAIALRAQKRQTKERLLQVTAKRGIAFTIAKATSFVRAKPIAPLWVHGVHVKKFCKDKYSYQRFRPCSVPMCQSVERSSIFLSNNLKEARALRCTPSVNTPIKKPELHFLKSDKEKGFLTRDRIFKSGICLRNLIPLDLALTPVLKVNFLIEVDDELVYFHQKTRERIILEVWTNGSVHPRQAVHDATLSLTDMFSNFRSVYQMKSYFLPLFDGKQLNKCSQNASFPFLRCTQGGTSRDRSLLPSFEGRAHPYLPCPVLTVSPGRP